MSAKTLIVASIIALTLFSGYLTFGNQMETEEVVLEARGEKVPEDVVERYIRWKTQYKPNQNSAPSSYRLAVFWENLKQIELVNNNPMSTYQLGENQFMDMTDEEFVETFLGVNHQPGNSDEELDQHLNFNGLNATVNWTAAGAVNAAPNQASCGSCWAFATTAVVEGYTFLKTGNLPTLSQQQLVDCATTYFGNLGCQGGNIYPTLAYIQQYGQTTTQAYPYVATQQKCKFEGGQYKIQSRSYNSGCNNLLQDLQTQPTGVYVDASNWKLYKSGVFNNCGTKLNHGVIATGYDQSFNWVIRNSWGPTWGVNGYMTLTGNVSTCGICSNLTNAY